MCFVTFLSRSKFVISFFTFDICDEPIKVLFVMKNFTSISKKVFLILVISVLTASSSFALCPIRHSDMDPIVVTM